MIDNLPTLWQNCILQYQTEIARKAWIWYADTRGSGMQYEADVFASEVETLVLTTQPMMQIAFSQHGPQDDHMDELVGDLTAFMLTRHANFRLGSNLKPTYIQGVSK